MFDIGFAELMLVGVAALIVVGPKDLPRMFRTVGQYVGRARGMARQFQRAMDDAADQDDLSELKDIGKSMKAAMDPLNSATNAARDYARQFQTDMTDLGDTGDLKSETAPDAMSREEQVKAANAASAAYVPPTPAETPEPQNTPADVAPPPQQQTKDTSRAAHKNVSEKSE